MATRQEHERRPAKAVPIYKQRTDWDRLPDYTKLPPIALIDMAEVSLLTSMSPSVIKRRVAAGEFRPPVRHGKNYLWPVGYVLGWLEKLNAEAGQ